MRCYEKNEKRKKEKMKKMRSGQPVFTSAIVGILFVFLCLFKCSFRSKVSES